MDVIKYNRPRTLGDLVAYELDTNFCRGSGLLLGGVSGTRTAEQFAVMGRINLGTPTVTPGAVVSGSGGTPGNGSIGTVTADPGAPAGTYMIEILNPAANAGAFQVRKPDLSIDGNGSVGVAYNGTINFTLGDSGTDFSEDDRIPVVVSYAADAYKFVPIDFAGVDGRQNAYCVNIEKTIAPDGVDTPIDYLERGPMILRNEELFWPAGATATQIQAAINQLQARNILVRTSG